jgi:hypothetical protein
LSQEKSRPTLWRALLAVAWERGGNPLDDLKLIDNLEKSLKVVMKDGRIFNNTL